jgi:hypothetical protein
MRNHEPLRLPSESDAPLADPVRLAASAYLARFTGSSREHTESDLRCYLSLRAYNARYTGDHR